TTNNLTDNIISTKPNNNHNNSPRNLNSPSGILPSTPLNNTQNNVLTKFAKVTSSPSLKNTLHTISIASLNVRGFASNVFKFNVINIYNHQKVNWLASHNNKGICDQAFTNFVIKQITDAEQTGFSVIILGDFNLNSSSFIDQQAVGHKNPAHFKLIEFLFERNYIDQHLLDENFKEYVTFYSQHSPISRIDLIWYPDDFIRDDFCFDQTWKLSCSYDLHPLDHNCVITYFTKCLFAFNT